MRSIDNFAIEIGGHHKKNVAKKQWGIYKNINSA
jgi:hypothetical protein